MAFTAKILSWRFRHLNIVGCLLKRRPTKGGSRAPQDPPPPSYAPVISNLINIEHFPNAKIEWSIFWFLIEKKK